MMRRVAEIPPASVRTAIQARILTLLRDHETLSRVDLSERIGLSRTTIAAELKGLHDSGIVTEAGPAASRGGRRSTLVRLADDLGFLGVDIGSTSIDIAVTDARLRVLAHVAEDQDIAQGPQVILARVRALVGQLRDQLPDIQIIGAGVGVPGPVDFDRGQPSSPPIMPGWDRYPVRDNLARLLDMPVVVDNDVNVMALGELHAGVAQRARTLLFVKIGTGIGCGIVVGGSIYRGVDGCAGDIGHIQATESGPVCACGNIGCLEAVFGGAALARDGTEAARSGRSATLAALLDGRPQDPAGRAVEVNAADVAHAAAAGDAEAVRLMRSGGRRLGQVLAGLVSFFNPAMIVIGGQVASNGHDLLAEVRDVIYRRALALATTNMPVVASELGGDAGVIGAARMAFDENFARQL